MPTGASKLGIDVDRVESEPVAGIGRVRHGDKGFEPFALAAEPHRTPVEAAQKTREENLLVQGERTTCAETVGPGEFQALPLQTVQRLRPAPEVQTNAEANALGLARLKGVTEILDEGGVGEDLPGQLGAVIFPGFVEPAEVQRGDAPDRFEFVILAAVTEPDRISEPDALRGPTRLDADLDISVYRHRASIRPVCFTLAHLRSGL